MGDPNNSPPKDNPNSEITKIKKPTIDLPLGGTIHIVFAASGINTVG